MSTIHKTVVLALVMGAALAIWAVPAGAAELPEPLVRFLPEQADVLVTIPSLDELDRAWAEAATLAKEFQEPGDDPMPTLAQMLEQIPPPYNEALDTTRPLAVALSLPNMMTGQPMTYRLIVPVTETDLDFQGLAAMIDLATARQEGGYLLLSPEPEVALGSKTTRLVNHLPAGVISACLDTRSLWGTYSPMLDMAMMSMAAQAPADSTGAPQPAMTPEQTAATGDMIRGLLGSADCLGLSLDLRDGVFKLFEELTVIAGSALDPPEQPDFNTALEMSRMLAPGSDLVAAYTLDVPGFMDLYKDYYLSALMPLMAEGAGNDSQQVAEMLEPLLTSMDQSMVPSVVALDVNGDRLMWQMVTKPEDPESVVAMQAEAMTMMGTVFPFLKVTAVDGLRTEGVAVLGWDLDLDQEALKSTLDDQSMAGSDQELSGMAGFFEKIMPGIRMAVHKDLVFATFGRDLDPLQEMLKQSKQRRGAPHPQLARAAQQAGDDCQVISTGDLGALLGLIFEMAEEISGEDMPALNLEPIMTTAIVRVGDTSYSEEFQMELSGMVGFMKAMQEMEALEKEAAGQ